MQYLVKWTGYADAENSWEPAANVGAAAIREYEAARGKGKGNSSAHAEHELQIHWDCRYGQSGGQSWIPNNGEWQPCAVVQATNEDNYQLILLCHRLFLVGN